jgi:hypothetical protein
MAIVSLGMRSDPSEIGVRPFGEDDQPSPESTIASDPVREAFNALGRGARSIDFWLLAGSFFVCGASTNGLIGTHLVPACMDHGMPEVQGAGLLAMMGLFDLVGTTASGWLSDRPLERRLRARVWSLSYAGCETTTAVPLSSFLDLCLCFCGSSFPSARQRLEGLRIDCLGIPFCADARPSQMLLGGLAQRLLSTIATKTPNAFEEAPPMAEPSFCPFSESKGAARRARDPDCSTATSQCPLLIPVSSPVNSKHCELHRNP